MMSISCSASPFSSLFWKTRFNIQRDLPTTSSSSALLFHLHPEFVAHHLSQCFRTNNRSLFLFLTQKTKPKPSAFSALTEYIKPAEISDQDSPVMASSSSSRLYVCNLPRSCGISELNDIFKPYGTVQSVEVSRNSETGVSRGCGYVTMSSVEEAKAAISALDASDVGGREMRVTFAADMNKELEAFGSGPDKNLTYESPHKIYVGNLARSVRPSDLRNLFSQFGTVVSSRVLHDRKSGKNRVYGFISFSSSVELENATSLDGTEFFGRKLLVREVLNNSKP